MAQFTNYDFDEVEDTDLFQPGEYPMQVTDAEVVRKDNGAEMLKLVYTILDGPYANRKVFGNYNIVHPSKQAQDIARRNIKSLCKAIGVMGNPADTEVLMFKPFLGQLGHTKASEQYPSQNEVKAWKPFQNPGPAPRPDPMQQQQPHMQAAPAGQGGYPQGGYGQQPQQSYQPPASQGGGQPTAGGVMPWERARR
ncbi:DUF669 domain-containing protein [Segnochrobactraceae bacterium EtOH-i3]